MTDAAPTGRRFNEREVAQIIKRASELQEQDVPPDADAAGMSLSELEQVAREAGLDPALVRRAAADVDRRHRDRVPSRFLGAPTTLRLERTIDGEVPVDEYESMVFEIQRIVGVVGIASSLGRSMQWTTASAGRPRANVRPVQVVVSPRNGRTTIRIEEPLGNIAGGLFGGLMGGVGGGLGFPLMAAGLAAFHSPAAALAMLTGAVGGSYLLARTIFGAIASRRGATLQALIERLAAHVSATTVAAPALPPEPGTAGHGEPGGDG